jgi:maltose phosphorylase
MAKVADKYFKVDEWKVIEEGFNPNYGEVSESIFSLGNEYMGVRGYFEEGYSGDKLIGSYFNGVYEMTKPDYGHYKGIVDFSEYMVNSVDWLYTRIEADGEQLDLATAKIDNFSRVLDLKTGVLTRSFVWTTKAGNKIELNFERFLSMTEVDKAAQKITFKAVDSDVKVKVTSGLDFSIIHQTSQKNMWDCEEGTIKVNDKVFLGIEGTTVRTKQKVYSSCLVDADYAEISEVKEDKVVAVTFTLDVKAGEEKAVTKLIKNFTCKEGEDVDAFKAATKDVDLSALSYEAMKEDTAKYWAEVWETSDIVIEGDEENQQGIRFCIFQMFQTYHGAVEGTNIGAKGLTGEAYNGNAFWDTETYCLPFFLFNNQEAARNLLFFRYKTLDEAKKRAKALDCEGAFYPIATISGKECCDLWQHASLQLQASTAVAYGLWFYEKMFDDKDFLKKYGLEMLIEVSRMLATRGDYLPDGSYGYHAVMGPDEFQMMVNNNCYTNYMGKFTLEYTLDKLNEVKASDAAAYKAVADKVALKEEELDKWADIAKNMFIPYHEDTKLFEQHDGFFKLPHLDVDAIPVEEFPLYSHWSYERIYRNDMIKQPDVLMFMLLFNSKFTQEQLKANYEYYEPRTIHESSLSPSVHSILAAQLKKDDEAYDFFGFATRMDLDNYNRNTQQGIHTTSIAAAWMNIVYGFGGLRSDGDVLTLAPSIPKDWNKYSFKITYKGALLEITVTASEVKIDVLNDATAEIKVYDKVVEIDKNGYTCPIA